MFEYKVLPLPKDPAEIIEALNKEGKDDWRLVLFTGNPPTHAWLERSSIKIDTQTGEPMKYDLVTGLRLE